MKTLKSVAQQIGSKTVNMVPTFGGKIAAGLFLGTANAVAGHAKSERAMKKIASRLADYFESKANSVMSTKDMMYAGLKDSYGRAEANNILKIATNASGIISGKELNWQECNKFKNINIEEAKKDGVVSICNRVKNVMEKASSAQQIASIRESIAKVVFPIIKGIYESEVVKPIVSTGVDAISTTIDEVKAVKKEEKAIDTIAKIKGWTENQTRIAYEDKDGKINREKLFQDLDKIIKVSKIKDMGEEENKNAPKGIGGHMDYEKLANDLDIAGREGMRVAEAFRGGVVLGEKGDSYICSGGVCKAENKAKVEGKNVEPGMVWDALNQVDNRQRAEVEKLKIERGDTVSDIMEKYKLSEDEIRKLNPQLVDLNRIIAGENLNIPKGSQEKVAASDGVQVGGSSEALPGILDDRSKIKIIGFTEDGKLIYENETNGTYNVIGGNFKTNKELVEEAVKEAAYQKFKQEVIKSGKVKDYIFNQEYQYGGSPLGLGGLRKTDYKVIEDIYLDTYLRGVFNEYCISGKVIIDKKKLTYQNNEIEKAKVILINKHIALDIYHGHVGMKLLKEDDDSKSFIKLLIGSWTGKRFYELKKQALKLEEIWQNTFPGGYVEVNKILAGVKDLALELDDKYEKIPILGHSYQAGKAIPLYVYNESPVWFQNSIDIAILPESILGTGQLLKKLGKGGSGIEILKEKYVRYKGMKEIERLYAKLDAAAEEGKLMIDGNRVGLYVGDKVELGGAEKRNIVEKGIGVGSDGELYISKEALERFKTVENGGQSGLKKGENDNIIKPYTGPSTGYKSKVGGKVVVESSVLDKYFGGKIKLKDHEGLAHGGYTTMVLIVYIQFANFKFLLSNIYSFKISKFFKTNFR